MNQFHLSSAPTAAAVPEEQRLHHPQDPLRAPLARQIRHPLPLKQEGRRRRRVNDLYRPQCQTPTETERPQAAVLFLFLLVAKEAKRVRNTKLGSAAAAKNVHA